MFGLKLICFFVYTFSFYFILFFKIQIWIIKISLWRFRDKFNLNFPSKVVSKVSIGGASAENTLFMWQAKTDQGNLKNKLENIIYC